MDNIAANPLILTHDEHTTASCQLMTNTTASTFIHLLRISTSSTFFVNPPTSATRARLGEGRAVVKRDEDLYGRTQ